LGHEIDILKSVRHPNIITFHDAWYNESEFVFITELMTSGTLREYIRKLSPLPNMKIVKRWCRQILKGLAYLHGYNPPIIHRDIKCDNIFINGAHGEIKIGDMGTAEMKVDKKYTLIGTPEFMAPEMYEEQGYNEKVDIYAFGMCLLEMVTGEYPYNECTNAAQVYKKVTQTIRPECISRVDDSEVLTLVTSCLSPEEERMSALEILEHSFLAVEPEVVLLATDITKKQLTLQVAFKGMDKLSVKFEFNADTDTAEDVVAEMIEEQVLPERYQQLITGDINRLLRDLNKQQQSDSEKQQVDDRLVWRRENDIRSELERAKSDLSNTRDKIMEAEKKCDALEQRTQIAEERYKETVAALEQAKQVVPDLDQVEESLDALNLDETRGRLFIYIFTLFLY
jgi:WNK lysine deficient protein kinase